MTPDTVNLRDLGLAKEFIFQKHFQQNESLSLTHSLNECGSLNSFEVVHEMYVYVTKFTDCFRSQMSMYLK